MKVPKANNSQASQDTDLTTQPFFYEIRVRGRLAEEKWTAWFSNLHISTERGESVLRGTLPDHAALYGLLTRLRDLAIPLLAVNVLDAEAQRKLHARSRRLDLMTNLVVLAIYLMLVGALVAITTFLTSGGYVHTALALATLFAAVGALAYTSWMWSKYPAWRWVSYASWASSLLTFLLYTSVADLLHPAVSIALMLFFGASGLIYLASHLRRHAESVDNVILEWESHGNRRDLPEQERADECVD